MNHFPILLQRNLHAQCASQACACVLCAKLLQCCCPRRWPARVPGAMQRQASTFLTHHIAPFTLHIWALFTCARPRMQYDLRCSAAKDNSITHAAAAPSNLDAATTMRSAETELQNTIELRAMASEIAAPKPDVDAKAEKRRFRSTF